VSLWHLATHTKQMENPLPCLSTSPSLPSAIQPETASTPAVVDPSLFLVPAANVVQMQATLAPSRISCATLGCKSTRIRRDCSRRSCKAHCLEAGRREANECQSPAHRGSTTETVHRNHPLLPLAPPSTALPSMKGLAPPSNMFVMPPPPIQLQIDPTLRATAPPQVTSVPPPFSSIDAFIIVPNVLMYSVIEVITCFTI
jgi:hypothetical protein